MSAQPKPRKRRVRLPGFKVTSELGRGGQGIVYKGVHVKTGTNVAIKFLHPGQSKNPEFRARFLRETDTALTVSHPNIVKAMKSGEIDNLLFYIMEFAEGKALDEILDQRRHLDESEVLSFAIQAAEALDFAHELGLVHRDIKPGNFIVSDSGHVKLLDLGMAKEVADGVGLTATGTAIGTPHYMSPEVTQDAKRVDARSDLFSLGITLYEAATGEVPFDDNNAFLVMEKICFEQATAPGSINPDISIGLESIILKLLEKKPELRYPTARKLKVDLERVRKGKEPIWPGSNARPVRGSGRRARCGARKGGNSDGFLKRTSDLIKRLLGVG